MKEVKKILSTGLAITCLASLILLIWHPWMSAVRISFGLFYILFLPGFLWSYVLFKTGEVDYITRVTLAGVLSLAMVTITVYFANLSFGISINTSNCFWIIFGLTAIAGLILVLKKYGYLK